MEFVHIDIMIPKRYERVAALMDASEIHLLAGVPSSSGDESSDAAPEKRTIKERIHTYSVYAGIISLIILVGLGITYSQFDGHRGPGEHDPTQAQRDQAPAILNSVYASAVITAICYFLWAGSSRF